MVPPELRAYAEGAAAGRAIDLGCGTATNVVYLAERGWDVVGVDFSWRAIERARRRVRDARADARLFVADVTALGDLGTFDLALDMGCFHNLDEAGRERYAAWLARSLRPGAAYLLYAFRPNASEDEVRRRFAGFAVERVEEGTGRPSAWYFLRRL